jgi:glycosyltransferase involved in cell wall biosynthesis
MRVAVVTPRFREPRAWLDRCLESVRRQTIPCTHVVVDDGGDPTPDDGIERIVLPAPHADFGDAARAIGSVSAIVRGYDAIAWLDADNWFAPTHLQTLLALHVRTGAAVVTSARMLHRLDGEVLGPCGEVDGERFVDTSCMMITRAAFPIVAEWYLMPRERHVVGDRVVWRRIVESGLTRAHTGIPTLSYRTPYRVHYESFGVPPPEGAKDTVLLPHDLASR